VAWFRVDDMLHSHPKARKAGLPAMGLWTLAGSFSMAYKLDGFVPEWFIVSWPNGKKLAGLLVEVECWEPTVRDGQPGWQFHDWDDYQPLAEEIEKRRAQSRDRQRRHRQKGMQESPNGQSSPDLRLA
jgi:hypothetical protein